MRTVMSNQKGDPDNQDMTLYAIDSLEGAGVCSG